MHSKGERVCCLFLGMGIFVSAAILSALWLTLEGCVSQNVGVNGVKLVFGGGNVEVVLSKAFEAGINVGDLGRGGWVANYDVVKVGCYAVEVLDDLVDDLDELAGRGIATMRHAEPFEESGGGANCGEGYSVFVDGCLVERRSNREKMRPLSREPRASSTRGMDSWPSELIALPSFLGMAIMGLAYGEVEC